MMTALLVVTLLLDTDRKLGTAVEWEASIEAAAARAVKEKKLVIAVHLSGRFDQPEFT